MQREARKAAFAELDKLHKAKLQEIEKQDLEIAKLHAQYLAAQIKKAEAQLKNPQPAASFFTPKGPKSAYQPSSRAPLNRWCGG